MLSNIVEQAEVNCAEKNGEQAKNGTWAFTIKMMLSYTGVALVAVGLGCRRPTVHGAVVHRCGLSYCRPTVYGAVVHKCGLSCRRPTVYGAVVHRCGLSYRMPAVCHGGMLLYTGV